MSARTKPVERDLTPYEAEQVEQIARWKSTPPNPVAELFKTITTSVTDLVEKVIPDQLVIAAIERVLSGFRTDRGPGGHQASGWR